MSPTVLEPGVYPDVPFDEYAAWRAINSSILHHYDKTPLHARYRMLVQEEETTSTGLGRLVHVAVLQPELLASEYIVRPEVDGRTKEGKRVLSEFKERAEGKILVTQDDMAVARGIFESIQQHPTAREALYGPGANELSLVWKDTRTSLLCKARIDRLGEIGGWPFVIDVKTSSRPATRWGFQKSVQTYGYHEQAAFYLWGLEQLRPLPEGDGYRKFAWLVCETEPPYAVRLFDAEDEALNIGLTNMQRYLQKHEECQRLGNWPGWEDGLETCGLPAWAYKGMQGEA